MVKIAVITPCYNTEKYIGDCLNSVAKSVNFGDFEFEHIVVDNGSTDKSWEIISNFADPHLKKFRFEKNEGQCRARNFAVSKTDADFIFCLDADDVVFQASLSALARFQEQARSDWIYFDYARVESDLAYRLGDDYWGWHFDTPEDILYSMYLCEHTFQGNSLFSRKIFRRVQGYNEAVKINADLDLYTRLLFAGYCPVYFDFMAYAHRNHDKNMSIAHSTDPNLRYKNRLDAYKRYRSELETALPADKITRIKELYRQKLGVRI